MARLMLFLITCREFFCLGLFSRRALQHGAFAPLAGKHRSPCWCGSGHSSTYPTTTQAWKLSRRGLLCSVSARNCVFVASRATCWQQESRDTLRCACVHCTHPARPFPCSLWNGASPSSKSTCRYWGHSLRFSRTTKPSSSFSFPFPSAAESCYLAGIFQIAWWS